VRILAVIPVVATAVVVATIVGAAACFCFFALVAEPQLMSYYSTLATTVQMVTFVLLVTGDTVADALADRTSQLTRWLVPKLASWSTC